ncbi:unnamed protein product, partial [Tuber aestivum]
GNEHQGSKHRNAGTLRSLSPRVPSGKPQLLMLFLLLISTPLAATEKTNFEQCGARVKELAKNNSLPLEDIYTGPVKGLLGRMPNTENPILHITLDACEKHCGSTPQFYTWVESSDTITTWVLPLVSLVLQAPFESNNLRQTILLVFRWVGSPIASMMYIFWNMKVTRKCAIMVDMSVKVTERQEQASRFAALRDSLYLLSVINQYELNICPELPEHHMEDILRVALFGGGPAVQQARGRVAASIRRERRRGVVQNLVSLAWFLAAMAISIYKAFGDLGENSTAHNLALGLLVSWLPVLVSATIVDRNPMDSHYVRTKLNSFLRKTVKIPRIPNAFPVVREPNFLGEFAGQARVRWHSGAAHPILRIMEATLDMRRDWLARYPNTDEVLATATHPRILICDKSQGWQIAAAIVIVFSCSIGAFIVSYFTSTIGLGCRSGGYMIFGLNAFFCLFAEMTAWVFLNPGTQRRVAQWFLRFCEFTNSCWLVYIIIAQTFGIYNSCYCKSSTWGGGEGYVDFEDVQYYKSHNIEISWLLGALIT